MSSITHLSVTTLAERIRTGALSPVDVIAAHIARIEAVNAAINAVVTPTFETARREAQAAATALAQGQPIGPLHGVPFTAKDSFDVAGVRATSGLVSRAGHVPAQDATVIARLRAAGAILLGKTNTPDNCGDYETINLLFGQTNNPWDVTRSAGGSTGGEGAIIAAGGSPLGIGTDIAGSIRIPAHFNGIVGLRPTSDTLPNDGQWPPIAGSLADLCAIGPLSRRVEDVALAFAVLHDVPYQPPDPAVLHGERVAFWFDDGLIPCSGAVKGGVQAAVAALKQAGMLAVHAAPAARQHATIGWVRYWRSEGCRAWARGFGNGVEWSPARELLRSLRGESRVAAGALLLWLAIHYGQYPFAAIDGGRWRTRLRAQMQALIGEHGVAVCPVFPTTAPQHGWVKRTLALASGYCTWVNLAGLPALTVPVGCSRKAGLPVGVQIVGAPGAEQAILAAGLAVQQTCMPTWNGPAI